MKRLTLRIDEYTYNKLYTMSKEYNVTINALINELVQIGFIYKESEGLLIEFKK